MIHTYQGSISVSCGEFEFQLKRWLAVFVSWFGANRAIGFPNYAWNMISCIFTFANSLFCIFEMDQRLAPIVIPNPLSGSCTLFFLDWRIDMASSITVSSLDWDEVLFSWVRGRLVDRLFSKILSSTSEGFSVSLHCSLSSLRWSIS